MVVKKSKEELQAQAEWFLEFALKNHDISKKTSWDISKILWLNESEKKWLIEWLVSKIWKEIDISDEKEVKKKLNNKISDFDNIRKKYNKYLYAKKIFEPYETINPKLNDFVLNYIFWKLKWNDELNVKNFKIFLSSDTYKNITKEQCNSLLLNTVNDMDSDDLYKFLQHYDSDELVNFSERGFLRAKWWLSLVLDNLTIFDNYDFDYILSYIKDFDGQLLCKIDGGKETIYCELKNRLLIISKYLSLLKWYEFNGYTFLEIAIRTTLQSLERNRNYELIEKNLQLLSKYWFIYEKIEEFNDIFNIDFQEFLNNETEIVTSEDFYNEIRWPFCGENRKLSSEQLNYLKKIFNWNTFDLSDRETLKSLFKLSDYNSKDRVDVLTMLENFNIIKTELPNLSCSVFKTRLVATHLYKNKDPNILKKCIKQLKELWFHNNEEFEQIFSFGGNNSGGLDYYFPDVVDITKMYMDTLNISVKDLLNIYKSLFRHYEHKNNLEPIFTSHNSAYIDLYKKLDNIIELKWLWLSNKVIIASQFTPVEIFQKLIDLWVTISEINRAFDEDPKYNGSNNKNFELFIQNLLTSNEYLGYYDQCNFEKVIDSKSTNYKINNLYNLLPIWKRKYILPLLQEIWNNTNVYIDLSKDWYKTDIQIAFEKIDAITEKISIEEFVQFFKWCNFHNVGIIRPIEKMELIVKYFDNLNVNSLESLKNIIKNWSITAENLWIIFEMLFGKYPNITIDELLLLENENTHILSLAKTENLKIILEKYSEITVKELVLLDSILKLDEKSFMEFSNFWTFTPSEASLNILDLFNDYTKAHDKIFANIENKEEINNENWIAITWLYSAIEYFEDDTTISDKIKSTIRELITNWDKKDFIYNKLNELLKKSLLDDNKLTYEEIALLAVLNKKWLFNMWQSESLAKFVYQINKLDKNYKFWKAFSEIKWNIAKFINTHRNDSNEIMNSFYQVSTSLLEKSPSIYRNLIKLLNKLDSNEQAIFFKDIFPLYNVELFLWEDEWKYTLLWTKINNDVEWQLIPMHERIKALLDDIDSSSKNDINTLLNSEKESLVVNIKYLFKEKFWIKKIPSEFTNENIESIKWHSIYLSNMHDRDDEKECVLWYFLALKLDWKRKEFREGKYFDPNEYMDDSKVWILSEYLSKRSERDSVYKLDDFEEKDRQILQENESNTIIWNTNWITERLKTIEWNIESLLDDDIYSDRQKIIKKYIDKDLWRLLAKQFQKISGRNIVLNDEEEKTLSWISEELWDDLKNIENIQKLQNECKPISSIINFVNKILNENLSKEIEDFEVVCKPSDEHLKLLEKIWINLEDDLIISSNSYLTYIESNIIKSKNKLTDVEYFSLTEYMDKVKKELDDLYLIKDKLTTLYEDFKGKIIDKYFKNTEIEQRFCWMSPYFFTKADVEKENIVSLMTNDLDIVIKNIRQCLWCKDKWCNNDTDLSFGCDDRFFITTSHREWDTSFADELVTLLPRSPKENWFTFVMDRIYWNNWSTDILLNNIYVILKKINKLSPELKKHLSIFIPNGIGLTLNEEWIEKIKKQYDWISIDQQEITVTVESQPISDSYHEFWWIWCRSTWDATISWYLIKL